MSANSKGAASFLPKLGSFADAIRLFDSPDGRDEAAAEAVGIWIGYAMLSEAIECQEGATAEEKLRLRSDLDFAHYKATEFLMKEAEQLGLNAAPLSEEQRVCRELFGPIRRPPTVPSPYPVRWFHHPHRMADTWPACLGAWRYELPSAMQETIRQGEEVFARLVARFDIPPAVGDGGNLDAYRQGGKPSGQLWTTGRIRKHLGVTGSTISRLEVSHPLRMTAQPNPDGRGLIYRHDLITALAENKRAKRKEREKK